MYSYAVAGANLFGQWFSDEVVIESFKRVTKTCPEMNFDLDKARLVQATWSYNIFEIDKVYYISGCWNKEDKQLITMPLPGDFPKDCINMLVAGNDNFLVIVDSEKRLTFIKRLTETQDNRKVYMIPGNTEERIILSTEMSNCCQTVKVMVANNASIYLINVDKVPEIYMGIYPWQVTTEHVMGNIIDVQCGYEHYMLLTDTGKVYTWGNGRRLQLGHGTIDNVAKPREVRALGGFNIKKIRAGGWHTAVVSEFGDLYMWGWNDVGQLGIKSRAMRRKELRNEICNTKKTSHPISTVINIYDEELNNVTLNVIEVCCGSKHTVIMLSDYSIWAAGSNEYGQLGLPIKDYSHVEHYVKVHQGTKDTVLRCGPWTTIIEN